LTSFSLIFTHLNKVTRSLAPPSLPHGVSLVAARLYRVAAVNETILAMQKRAREIGLKGDL